MDKAIEYKFKINAFTPATFPMARLAEYVADLAKMLGNQENIHFSHLETGSSVVAYKVDLDVALDVTERVANVRAGVGPQDALQAVQRINKRLIEDRTDGSIEESKGAEIIRFPGFRTESVEKLLIKTPMQPDSLDGVVQRVGRFGDKASILIEAVDGSVFTCKTDRTTARRLAVHIFGVEVRLHGFGRWQRNPRGNWTLDDFFVQRFDVLGNVKLSDVIAELHAVQGSEWHSLENPWLELSDLRGNQEEDQL